MKLQIILIFMISIFSSMLLPAQEKQPGTGVIIDDTSYSKVPRLNSYSGAKTKRAKWKYSLRKYAPLPGHQGTTNSCVGWAVGYAAMTIHQAIQSNTTDKEAITANAFSPSFIFNQINQGQCNGALITDALVLLKNKGDCRLVTFSNARDNCVRLPDTKALEEATQFKIKDFASPFYNTDAPAVKIEQTIQSILHDNPLIVVFQVTKSFRNIEIGQTIWKPNSTETKELTGHAMVVTGFNKKLRRFELMNSWGTNWGEQGFIWISFDDFAKHALYGFQLLPDNWHPVYQPDQLPMVDQQPTNSMSGNLFVLSSPPSDESSEAVSFQSEPGFSKKEQVSFNDQTQSYQFILKDWRVYEGFKLQAENLTKGIYFYLLNLNPQGEATYLYPLPKDIKNDRHFAHYIAGDSLEVAFPPDDEWLQLDYPGKDHLIALFSWQAIENVEAKIDQLTKVEGTIEERLQIVFKETLIPSNQIAYSLDKMAFSINFPVHQKNAIVPLILAIDVQP